jgi:HK97 family phage prohead protease
MELRDVNPSQRLVIGIVSPYDETTYLAPNPNGERIRRGAFAKSIRQRGTKIPLHRNHDRNLRFGLSRSFTEEAGGLLGEFVVNPGDAGDRLLEECRDGYLPAMSAGWLPLSVGRGGDGVSEVTEAKLVEVSLVGLPAYEGAQMLAVRSAQNLDDLLAPFRCRPDVNLDPIPPVVYRHR